MHRLELPEGAYWACDQPERPNEDGVTYYDARCPACRIAQQAAVLTGGLGSFVELDGTGRPVKIWSSLDDYIDAVGSI